MPSQPLPTTLIGAATVDVIARVHGDYRPATSNPGWIRRGPGGVARNIAVLLARLGAPAHLITALGDDADGAYLRAHLRQSGVTVSLVPAGDQPTARYVALHDDRGELIAAIADMAIVEALDADAVVQAIDKSPNAGNLLADCGLAPDRLRRICDDKGGRRFALETVSAPKAVRARGLEGGIDLLLCNRQEASALLDREFSCAAAAVEGALKAGVGAALVSDGAEAVAVGDRDGIIERMPLAAEIVDVTGAGDALTAGTLYGLARGLSLGEAVDYGLAAASLAVEATGAGVPITRDALTARLGERSDR